MSSIKVAGTIAFKGLLAELEPAFTRKTGTALAYAWGPPGMVHKWAREGQVHDMLIVTPEIAKEMEAEGLAAKGSTVDLGKSVIGIAVQAGAPKPKIDTVDAVKAAIRSAKRITYSDPATTAPSGVHVANLLKQWGMLEETLPKTVYGKGGPVADLLLSGEADLGLQQLCEHMLVKGVDVVGAVPMEIQKISTFTAVIGSKASDPAAAKALIDTMISPETRAILGKHGLFALDAI